MIAAGTRQSARRMKGFSLAKSGLTSTNRTLCRAATAVPFMRPRSTRGMSTEQDLKTTLAGLIPEKRERLAALRKNHGAVSLGEVRIENTLGGMRGLKTLLWEGSVLDAEEGIRFHGLSIPEAQARLPVGKTGRETLPESMLWLVLTGQIPTPTQVEALAAQLARDATLPGYLLQMLDAMPRSMHPMTQFTAAVAALNHESKFAQLYESGMNKADYWESMFDDCLSLFAKLPAIAAKIFKNAYQGGGALPGVDQSMDMSHNMALMMDKADVTDFVDLLRLYIALHGDHEGGNVSAHAAHLVGSALSAAPLAYSAALAGLAGPLHGLAAQEVLRWILNMQAAIGEHASDSKIRDYLWSTLKSGQVVPGYGHGVLRQPDPRFKALHAFGMARKDIQNDPVFQLVSATSRIAPDVLKEHGKTKNPYPNVDAQSGVLFHHYGLHETRYYTVVFGVSRAIGALSQLIWDRALGLPIERPKSVSIATLESLVQTKA